jgi:hypothetical protein
MSKEWFKKYAGLLVAVAVTLFCFAAIFTFHIRSSDVQKALDRPLPVIKEVDPNSIDIEYKSTTQDQSTPSATKDSAKP